MKNAKPLRSQKTRDCILIAARRLFGEQGFEKTTIRAVGAAAAINPSMVMRYYSSEEELFAAAARVDFRMPDLALVSSASRGVALVTHVLEQWEGAASEELQAIVRAAGTHEFARPRLAEVVEKQAVPAIRSVPPVDRIEERLGPIIMQVAGLVLSRYLFRHPSVTVLSQETIISSTWGCDTGSHGRRICSINQYFSVSNARSADSSTTSLPLDDAEAATTSHPRMRLVFESAFDQSRCVRSNGSRPAHYSQGRPLQVFAMASGPVFAIRNGLPLLRLQVRSNSFSMMEDLDCRP